MSKRILGIDFGTCVLKIYKRGEGVIVDEKTVIAIANKNNVISAGDEAFEMLEKAPANIQVSYPMKNGVVADIYKMQYLVNYFLKKALHTKKHFSSADYLVAVPTDVTEVEKRAFYDLVSHSDGKAKRITLIEKPLAAALGIGLDVTNAQGCMTVDIGAETTEISIMSLGGIVISKIIPIGGRHLDTAIQLAVKKEQNILIGDKTAERLKKELGSAVCPEEDRVMKVYGRDVMSGLPKEAVVPARLVYMAIEEQIHSIIDAVRVILERTPPEISSDIIDTGIYITGGSAKIADLQKLVSQETDLKVNIADDCENSVVNGLGTIIENDKLFKKLSLGLKLQA
ncbi:MAG: rod shape-determining protein [Clostridiales bacterium]|nr:rod shape-determining protein [Clostridiales bacterium]